MANVYKTTLCGRPTGDGPHHQNKTCGERRPAETRRGLVPATRRVASSPNGPNRCGSPSEMDWGHRAPSEAQEVDGRLGAASLPPNKHRLPKVG